MQRHGYQVPSALVCGVSEVNRLSIYTVLVPLCRPVSYQVYRTLVPDKPSDASQGAVVLAVKCKRYCENKSVASCPREC